MQDKFENPETPETKSKASRLTVTTGALVTAAILLSFWFLFEPLGRKSNATHEAAQLLMNPAEKEYTKNIEVGQIAMSRAENFLHQEVTTLTGELHNAGSKQVLGVSVTAEFSDDMSQIVLRETRSVLGSSGPPLAPGARRSFEISFEHIPNSWNMQAPSVRVSQLRLPTKQ
ncbi:MAG: hypothetical protein WAM58_02700 [Candidatus Acidiferrum sp.]